MKFYSAFLIVAIAGCKTASTTDTKSLDNFSRSSDASLNVNECSGSSDKDFDLYWGEGATEKDRIFVDSPLKDQLKDTIKKTLSAVPEGLQDWFFDKGGKLIISSNASATCRTEATRKGDLSEAEEAYHSCWKMESGKFPIIYINANPDISRKKFGGEGSDQEILRSEIQHSLVRSFGYVFSEVLVRLSPKQGDPETFDYNEGDPEIQADKELLSWKFITDTREQIKAGKKVEDLPQFSDTFKSKTVLDPVKTTYEQAWKEWYTQYKSYDAKTKTETKKSDEWAEKARIFQDQVYAEAFDSYYCNAETRKQLTENKAFNSSGSFFAKNIVPGLEEAFAERTKTDSNTAAGAAAKTNDTATKPDATEAAVATNEDSTEAKVASPLDAFTLTAPSPDEGTGMALTGYRYPILRGLLAVVGAIAYPVRAVANWATNRNVRVQGSLVRGQPLRNTLRIINGGPAGWRAERWRQTGGFQPVQRLQRGCLVRRWRC